MIKCLNTYFILILLAIAFVNSIPVTKISHSENVLLEVKTAEDIEKEEFKTFLKSGESKSIVDKIKTHLNKHKKLKKFQTAQTEDEQLSDLFTNYQNFKTKHKKKYIVHTENYSRFANFLKKNAFIEDFNATPGKSFTVEHNKFSDLSEEEANQLRGLVDITDIPTTTSFLEKSSSSTQTATSLGPAIDWVSKGILGPVQNQGECGSCWAFGAMQLVDAWVALKKGLNVSFSRQQFLDCVTAATGKPGSCNGGHYYHALNYLANKQVALSSAYPYIAAQNPTCNALNSSSPQLSGSIAAFSTFTYIDLASQEQVYNLLKNGPVAVSIDSTPDEFMNYGRGVLTYNCGAAPNHAVTLVGYGYDATSNKNYWVIRNTWGSDWGNGGHLWIEQNPNWNSCWIYKSVLSISG